MFCAGPRASTFTNGFTSTSGASGWWVIVGDGKGFGQSLSESCGSNVSLKRRGVRPAKWTWGSKVLVCKVFHLHRVLFAGATPHMWYCHFVHDWLTHVHCQVCTCYNSIVLEQLDFHIPGRKSRNIGKQKRWTTQRSNLIVVGCAYSDLF